MRFDKPTSRRKPGRPSARRSGGPASGGWSPTNWARECRPPRPPRTEGPSRSTGAGRDPQPRPPREHPPPPMPACTQGQRRTHARTRASERCEPRLVRGKSSSRERLTNSVLLFPLTEGSDVCEREGGATMTQWGRRAAEIDQSCSMSGQLWSSPGQSRTEFGRADFGPALVESGQILVDLGPIFGRSWPAF